MASCRQGRHQASNQSSTTFGLKNFFRAPPARSAGKPMEHSYRYRLRFGTRSGCQNFLASFQGFSKTSKRRTEAYRMHVGADFLKLPPVTGQYWSLFQCSMLGTGGTCESPRSSPRLSGSQVAALPGRARWVARSKRRPPLAGARARAGGAGTSRGKSTRCTSCRSPSARSNTGSGTVFAAIPCASLRRGTRSPSGDWATRRMARPAAQQCGRPPPGLGYDAARPHGRSHVDDGQGVGPRHADQSACPHCGAAHEDEVHVLWDCPE